MQSIVFVALLAFAPACFAARLDFQNLYKIQLDHRLGQQQHSCKVWPHTVGDRFIEFLVRSQNCRVHRLKGVDVQGIHQVAGPVELHSPSGKKSNLFLHPYGMHMGMHRGEDPIGIWRMYLHDNILPQSVNDMHLIMHGTDEVADNDVDSNSKTTKSMSPPTTTTKDTTLPTTTTNVTTSPTRTTKSMPVSITTTKITPPPTTTTKTTHPPTTTTKTTHPPTTTTQTTHPPTTTKTTHPPTTTKTTHPPTTTKTTHPPTTTTKTTHPPTTTTKTTHPPTTTKATPSPTMHTTTPASGASSNTGILVITMVAMVFSAIMY